MAGAQYEDWQDMAPEGKIINYRTLTWNDFQHLQMRHVAEELSQHGLQAQAYVIPTIYFEPIDAERLDNGRLKFKFKVKCAFQSHAYVRDDVKKAHTNYVLYHEQGHYDIALNFANIMQEELCSKDFSPNGYDKEIGAIIEKLYTRYHELQERYDAEVNPHGTDDVPMQTLWDMRIKKALENNSIEYYTSPESVAATVKGLGLGQTVKRLPTDDVRRFAVRARPLYSEFTDETAAMTKELSVWNMEKVVLAFYQQRYFVGEEGKPVKDCSRLLGYLFVPNGKDTYKRIFIDTFVRDDLSPKVNASFFANADTDAVKELVIQTVQTRKDNEATGVQYTTRVYDNTFRALPGKLRKLNDVAEKLENSVDGTVNGKPQKAKYKTEKDLRDALQKLGYAEETPAAAPPKKTIYR
ncbi:hypothetical protein GCM10023093_00300 [Nemorincola caseinilytica]|uniref:Uncharacterized protein n=1 Tax=Nemorincola caseinilytica TaxID=2054315 RepID=A0ABP8N0V8_9BACT